MMFPAYAFSGAAPSTAWPTLLPPLQPIPSYGFTRNDTGEGTNLILDFE
uniref:Bm8528 n=1 Tax=Brugia malayi TaxID=6279 RepID=A0A1I9G980_BRUMA|nr:Bm8528 [Brugia malayi]